MDSFAGLPLSAPEAVGFDATRLSRVGDAMRGAVEGGHVPAVATVVARRGQVVHREACGVLDLETGAALPIDGLFRMYSQSKPVTAAAAMVLFEEGLFFLDDPITNWLPEFTNRRVVVDPRDAQRVGGEPLSLLETVPALRDITIYDLLTMTSGLANVGATPTSYWQEFRDAWEGSGFWPGDTRFNDPTAGSLEGVVQALAQLPGFAQPGEQWLYGSDFDVLTVLLERASDQTIDEILRTRLFEPLGMHDSDFYCPADKQGRLATDHTWAPDGSLRVHDPVKTAEKANPKPERRLMSGNGFFGGILSTPADYTRFAQMLLNGGEVDGVRVLGRKTVELLATNHLAHIAAEPQDITLGLGPGYGFGFGVCVRDRVGGSCGPGSVGTYGWGGAAGTWYFVDPVEELVGLFFTNVFGYQFAPNARLQQRFEHLVYAALT